MSRAVSAKLLPPRRLQAFQICRDEKGVVIEHLFEVRHQPTLVGRIAVESAADLVIHAAGRHFFKRQLGHRQGALVASQAVMA